MASKFISRPDFAMIANGFGIQSYDLDKLPKPLGADALAILKGALLQKEPCLVNVPIHFGENVYPMVPPGKAINIMLEGQSVE